MNRTKITIDPDWLRKRYLDDGKTIYDIAAEVGCSPRTVHQRLIKYGIPRRQGGFRVMPELQKQLRRDWWKKNPDHKPMSGKKHSLMTRETVSRNRQGAKNANWKGGVTARARKLRATKEYRSWKRAVISQAEGICQECGEPAALEAHHIISIFKDFALALNLDNGKAVCNPCHGRLDGSQ